MPPEIADRQYDDTAHLISRARCAINRFLGEALRDQGLGDLAPSHGDILAVLLAEGEMTMTALARCINRDPSTVTTLVHKLATLGYLTYRDNPEDARSRLVALTSSGLAMRSSFEEISAQLAHKLWHGVAAGDREVCRRTLSAIIKNFRMADG